MTKEEIEKAAEKEHGKVILLFFVTILNY